MLKLPPHTCGRDPLEFVIAEMGDVDLDELPGGPE
jgi:hypothetical protein